MYVRTYVCTRIFILRVPHTVAIYNYACGTSNFENFVIGVTTLNLTHSVHKEIGQ